MLRATDRQDLPNTCPQRQGRARDLPLPVYSATDAREDAADAVSQSLSVLRLGLRLSVGKASRDSTLKQRGGGGRGGTVTGIPSCPAPTLRAGRNAHRGGVGQRPHSLRPPKHDYKLGAEHKGPNTVTRIDALEGRCPPSDACLRRDPDRARKQHRDSGSGSFQTHFGRSALLTHERHTPGGSRMDGVQKPRSRPVPDTRQA